MILLVDGYNMIGAWPELRNDDLDKSRIDLVERLANYGGFTGEEVVVVFDGHQSGRVKPTYENRSGVLVVYTKGGETADQFIERFVHERTAHLPRMARPILRVATSDALEQSVVLSRGAVRVSAHELRGDVYAARNEMKKTLQRRAPVKPNMLGARLEVAALKKLEEIRGGGDTEHAGNEPGKRGSTSGQN